MARGIEIPSYRESHHFPLLARDAAKRLDRVDTRLGMGILTDVQEDLENAGKFNTVEERVDFWNMRVTASTLLGDENGARDAERALDALHNNEPENDFLQKTDTDHNPDLAERHLQLAHTMARATVAIAARQQCTYLQLPFRNRLAQVQRGLDYLWMRTREVKAGSAWTYADATESLGIALPQTAAVFDQRMGKMNDWLRAYGPNGMRSASNSQLPLPGFELATQPSRTESMRDTYYRTVRPGMKQFARSLFDAPENR